jgi:membrane protein
MSLFRRTMMRNRRIWAVARDTVVGTWADGFTHAGNLAYLSLLTLFPFIIILATVAGAMGRTDEGMLAVQGFLRALPPNVAALVAKPIEDVISVRASSGLLTFGILVTLWTSSGFIETIREIIHQAYDVPQGRSVWRNRIGSVLIIFAAVFLMLAAFAAQIFLTSAEAFVARVMPYADGPLAEVALGRFLPAIALFVALFLVFLALTPQRFIRLHFPIWPGPLAVTIVWVGTTMGMPRVLRQFGGYTLTYGSLAGVIVTLLFFYIIGLALVFGAQLNAALAKARQNRLETGQSG